jgi:hypothetical protein
MRPAKAVVHEDVRTVAVHQAEDAAMEADSDDDAGASPG